MAMKLLKSGHQLSLVHRQVLISCMFTGRLMVDWPRRQKGGSTEIDQLAKTINEQSEEQRRIISEFSRAMNNFATERSLETCIDALNASMQLANIRSKLAESFEFYARSLEREIITLRRSQNPNQE